MKVFYKLKFFSCTPLYFSPSFHFSFFLSFHLQFPSLPLFLPLYFLFFKFLGQGRFQNADRNFSDGTSDQELILFHLPLFRPLSMFLFSLSLLPLPTPFFPPPFFFLSISHFSSSWVRADSRTQMEIFQIVLQTKNFLSFFSSPSLFLLSRPRPGNRNMFHVHGCDNSIFSKSQSLYRGGEMGIFPSPFRGP